MFTTWQPESKQIDISLRERNGGWKEGKDVRTIMEVREHTRKVTVERIREGRRIARD